MLNCFHAVDDIFVMSVFALKGESFDDEDNDFPKPNKMSWSLQVFALALIVERQARQLKLPQSWVTQPRIDLGFTAMEFDAQSVCLKEFVLKLS